MWLQEPTANRFIEPENVVCLAKARLHNTGKLAARITGVGVPNHCATHEVPVHDLKVRVWCALCFRKII